ncbi:hypothetical protein [Nocardia sp. NPDC058480]|uniref:hypothetical protein n=1 Tax=Nocardia sp. NPDC058480 TaxID=3346522 RepID=UPI00364ADAA3
MIAMSHIDLTIPLDDEVTAEYIEAHTLTTARGTEHWIRAYVRLQVSADAGLVLDIEHVRQLAEVLPGVLMAHDAAEREKAVVKAAAEIDSAYKAA